MLVSTSSQPWSLTRSAGYLAPFCLGAFLTASGIGCVSDAEPGGSGAPESQHEVRVQRRSLVTTWSEVAKVTASDAADWDNFGTAVAILGDWAVVGAPDTGGNEDAGAAYVFHLDESGVWVEVQKLTADSPTPGARFGTAVAMSEGRALIGAGADGTTALRSGAAYLFELDASGSWTQAQKFTASDAASADGFGASVALSGDRVLVGANGENEKGDQAGAAYIFERDASGDWAQLQKLTASDGATLHQFGSAVAIDGARALIGAWGTGADRAGSAYLFERDSAGDWIEVERLAATDEDDNYHFGIATDLRGDLALVGAIGAENPNVPGLPSGAAYLFERDSSGAWTQIEKLLPADGGYGHQFGDAVALGEGRALIGSHFFESDTTGTNLGAVYFFERDASGSWVQSQQLFASDHGNYDWFGHSVALSGHRAFIGAPNESEAATSAGAAYVFEFPNTAPVAVDRSGIYARSGVEVDIELSGTDADGDPLSFVLADAPLNGSIGLGAAAPAQPGTFDPATDTTTLTVTYMAESGSDDAFTFLVDDGNGGVDEGRVEIDIAADNVGGEDAGGGNNGGGADAGGGGEADTGNRGEEPDAGGFATSDAGGETGGTGAAREDDGCGCASNSGTSPDASIFLVLAGFLALGWRRRR